MLYTIFEYIKTSYNINPIGQTIGFIWFFLSLIAYLNKKDTNTQIIHGISLAFWSLHFYSIWLLEWSIVNAIWSVRGFASVKYKWNNKVLLLFLLLYIPSLFLTYKNLLSIIPFTWATLNTIAFFKLKWIKMRLLLILCSSLWLIYNYIWHSIWWLVVNVFLILANTITIIRLIIIQKIKLW